MAALGRGRLFAACLTVLVCGTTLAAAQADAPSPAPAKQPATVADLYPFVSLVSSKDTPLCVGTLVAPWAVLTAASCVTGGAPPDLVHVGLFNSQLDEFRRPHGYEIRWVERVKRHPNFTEHDPRENNLALLVLRTASKHVPTPMAGASFVYPLNSTNATTAGFGSLSADGFWPQLHSDQLTLMPEDECSGLQTAYGTRPQGQAQACTGLSHSFRACALGNLGAPLLMERESGNTTVLVQAAVLTGGFACSTDPTVASPSSPALYAWLPRYADWLRGQLADIEEETAKRERHKGKGD